MYFDTLKASTVEQSTEQTAAHGGLGNAAQVVWDYGKEVTIQLQDALYTPASQSLLWNGTYGLKPIKVKGVWVPAEYPEDEYGNKIYFQQKVVNTMEETEDCVNTTEGTNWLGFYCPCNEEMKYKTYEVIEVKKAEYNEDKNFLPVSVTRGEKEVQINGQTITIEMSNNEQGVIATFPNSEKAELYINNFADFNTYSYIQETDTEYNFKKSEKEDYSNYHSILEYCWTGCQGQMVTNSVNKSLAYCDDIDFRIYSFQDNTNKRFLFGQDTTQLNVQEDQLIFHPSAVPHHHFYKTITKKLKGFEVRKVEQDGEEKLLKIPVEKKIELKVYLGTFFIIEDWNINNTAEEPGIHLIDSKVENTKILNNMIKKEAKDYFAIRVDSNIQAYNAIKNYKYSNSNLVVYIDPTTLMPYEANSHSFKKQNGKIIQGNLKVFKPYEEYYIYDQHRTIPEEEATTITVRAQDYPNMFKIVGETYTRDWTGEDTHYQIELPYCKLSSNISLDLSADGSPATVDLSFVAIPQFDGSIMKITRYKDTKERYYFEQEPVDNYTLNIKAPISGEVYCVGTDCRIQESDQETYLRLPETQEEAATAARVLEEQGYEVYIQQYRHLLLIEILNNDNLEAYLTKDNYENIDLKITYGSDD